MFVCFGGSTLTQMQELQGSALVKPLSQKVCNSPLEPICILVHTYTRAHTRDVMFMLMQTLSIASIAIFLFFYFSQHKFSPVYKPQSTTD